MSKMKKFFFTMVMFSALAGCNEAFTYSYLMEHPAVVKREMERCQGLDEKSAEQVNQCALVLQAATDLMSILNEQQMDPENFGQRIMDSELAYTKAYDTLREAQQGVDTLKNKNASAAELQVSQDKVNKAMKSYEETRKEMKVLLAVVGVNSPE
jgi:chromosome segregation ATPase